MKIWIEKELFQWEKERYVYIDTTNSDPEINLAQFYNKKSTVSWDVPVEGNQAKIPNELLKQNLPIMVLACVGEKDSSHVINRREFRVINRAKPQNYVEDNPEDNPEPDFPDDTREVIYDGGEEV